MIGLGWFAVVWQLVSASAAIGIINRVFIFFEFTYQDLNCLLEICERFNRTIGLPPWHFEPADEPAEIVEAFVGGCDQCLKCHGL